MRRLTFEHLACGIWLSVAASCEEQLQDSRTIRRIDAPQTRKIGDMG